MSSLWISKLLSKNDFTSSANVLSSLGGTFVGTSLKTNNGLSSFKNFIGEVSFVFCGWFGSKERSSPFWVFVAFSSKGEQSVCDLSNVFLFPKVDCLEKVYIWNTIGGDSCQETETKEKYLIGVKHTWNPSKSI